MRFTAVSCEVPDTAVLFYSFRWDVRKTKFILSAVSDTKNI